MKAVLAMVGVLFAAHFVEAFDSATHNVRFPIISAAYNPDNEAFLVGWIMALWGLGKIAAVVFSLLPCFHQFRSLSSGLLHFVQQAPGASHQVMLPLIRSRSVSHHFLS